MGKYVTHVDLGETINAALRPAYQWSQREHVIASAAYTRPANTTAYATLDAVSDSTSAPTALNFANVVRENGGHGVIKYVRMLDSVLGTLPTSFKLILFDTTPTPTNDNAALSITDANAANIVAVADLLASAALSATANAYYHLQMDVPFQAAAADRDLYGLVQVVGVYTPASAEVFTFEIGVEQH
jgi:hypothetical protein